MSDRFQHLDFLFAEWPYEFGEVIARIVSGSDARDVLQLRVEMGVLQMEVTGRPDGSRPGGHSTCLDWLHAQMVEEGDNFTLDPDRCLEIDREFVQFFHRRVGWLALRAFDRAVADADHTLALMDFSSLHAPDVDWAEMHEQYRPFVLFHRTQAAALGELERQGATAAVAEIDAGLAAIRTALESDVSIDDLNIDGLDDEDLDDDDDDDVVEDDELIVKLTEMKAAITEQFHIEPSLREQLSDAIAAEQYERAAQLRDQLHRKSRRRD
jgi:hypothetical protein